MVGVKILHEARCMMSYPTVTNPAADQEAEVLNQEATTTLNDEQYRRKMQRRKEVQEQREQWLFATLIPIPKPTWLLPGDLTPTPTLGDTTSTSSAETGRFSSINDELTVNTSPAILLL